MRKKKKDNTQKQCICLTAAMLASNVFQVTPVSADTLEFAGTTQISTNDYYLSADTFAEDLVVEEVFVSAGDYLEEGDKILKLTSESYQDALDYYEAAILRADNSLTDTQLEYDQGVLKSKYAYEEAMADSENAGFIKEYQSSEVAKAIADHEQALQDIDDRITELEAGIADGSYDVITSSAAGGNSGTGTGGNSGGTDDGSSGTLFDENTTGEQNSDEKNSDEKNSDEESPVFTDGTTGGEGQSDPDTGKEVTQGTENNVPGSSQSADSEQSGNDQPENSQPENNQPGNDRQDTDTGSADGKSVDELKRELEEKASEVETLVNRITEEIQNVTEKLSTDTDNNNSEDYAAYANQLNNIINQLTTDIQTQENVRNSLQNGEDFTNTGSLEESIQGNSRVLESLKDIREKITKYQSIISFLLGIMDTGAETVLVDAGLLSDISEYLKIQDECSSLYNCLIEAYEKELSEETTESNGKTDNNFETDNNDEMKETVIGTGGSDMSGTEALSSERSGSETSGGSGASGGSETGGSGMSGSGETGGSGGGAGSAEVSQTSEGNQKSGMSGQSDLSGEDISLLGDTYDLTSVENLLSREPSGSDDAQDLIEELQDSRKNVELQYEELQRKEKIFELEIQHTYDTAIINAKLAEITYQQDMDQWEETLAEAKQAKANLEEQKAQLESMTDGIITADRSGTAASVSYEAEDVLSSEIPVISYYDTDIVTVTIEIGQENIAKLAVGDAVDVTVGGYMKYKGTVTEKSVVAESGTSRTTVNYTAVISINNENGRLSSGASASVTVSVSENTESEGAEVEEEKVNE